MQNTAAEAAYLQWVGLGVRTFLCWSIVVEIEERWPWQRRGADATIVENSI
jgi:hypothetical protein